MASSNTTMLTPDSPEQPQATPRGRYATSPANSSAHSVTNSFAASPATKVTPGSLAEWQQKAEGRGGRGDGRVRASTDERKGSDVSKGAGGGKEEEGGRALEPARFYGVYERSDGARYEGEFLDVDLTVQDGLGLFSWCLFIFRGMSAARLSQSSYLL